MTGGRMLVEATIPPRTVQFPTEALELVAGMYFNGGTTEGAATAAIEGAA